MTLQQLRYIVALDSERHFARAAEACFVTQPGLTLQLKALEEELGVKIFDRSVVPLRPTKLGQAIIAKAKKILQDVDSLQSFVVDEKNVLSGEVRLGVISTLSPYLIPQLIATTPSVLPDVQLTIREASTVQLMHELEQGDIDVALMATPTGNKSLREFPVFYEPFVAFLNASNRSDVALNAQLTDAAKAQLLLMRDEYCYNAQLLDICALNPNAASEKRFSYSITSIETLKNMVRADLGWAIVPELSVLNAAPNDIYRPFSAPQPVREISLVVSDAFYKTLLLEKLKTAIWTCLPEKLRHSFNYKKISWSDSPYFKQIVGQK